MSAQAKNLNLFEPMIVKSGVGGFLAKLDPRVQVRNPVMFVVGVGQPLTTGLFFDALRGQARRLPGSSARSRCGCGSRCCSPTSPKRWPRDAARRKPTALRKARSTYSRAKLLDEPQQGLQCCSKTLSGRRIYDWATCVLVEAGESFRRRRSHRGRRLGRRKRHHGRKRPGHPRKRRRPQQRHRRHASPFRLAGRARHGAARRDFFGSHDRDGRRRQAAKDAQ